MGNRTIIRRDNDEGFGYIFTATLDLLKRNPNLSTRGIQNHFDCIIGMALADLLVEDTQSVIEINKSLFKLKSKLIPGYPQILEAIMSTGEDPQKPNQNTRPETKSDCEKQ